MERIASIATIVSAICSVAGLALQLAPVLGAPLTGFAVTMAESSVVWLPVATFILGLSIGAWAVARKGTERIAEKDAEIARSIELKDREIDSCYQNMGYMIQTLGEAKRTLDRASEAFDEAGRHIESQDEQLKRFYDVIIRMNEVIEGLTEGRLLMLSDAEKRELSRAYLAQSPCEIDDEDVARHLVMLGALDELPSGLYAVSGEWRRALLPAMSGDSADA